MTAIEQTMPSAADGDGEDDYVVQILYSVPLLRSVSNAKMLKFAQASSIGVFMLSTLLFVVNGDRGSLIERPTQSCFLGFLVSGFAITILHLVLQDLPRKLDAGKESMPLSALSNEEHGKLRDSSGSISGADLLMSRRGHLRSLLVVAAIVLRVFCFEQILMNNQCAVSGIEALLPFLVAISEKHNFQIHTQFLDRSGANLNRGFVHVVVPAAIVSWASVLASRLSAHPVSTVICPAIRGTTAWVIGMQLCGVLLDAWVLHAFKERLSTLKAQKPSGMRGASLLLGLLLMLSGVLVMLAGLLTTIHPQYRGMLSHISGKFVLHVSWAALLFTVMAMSFLRILAYGAAPLDVLIIVAVLTSFVQVRSGLENIDTAASPNLYLPTIPPLLLVVLGSAMYFYASRTPSEAGAGASSQRRPLRTVLYLLFIATIGVVVFRELFGTQNAPRFVKHPIEDLIQSAGEKHHNWVQQASTSKTLHDALQEYKRRYGRHPPPGFDKWYDYATKRSSAIIDDYDTIDENLRPFWKLEPGHIRTRTKSLLSDTANDCAEVSIRSGNASIGRVIPTHRWMVDGIIKMMDGFVTELPDMDIAFNINDEPRVAIPYSARQMMETAGTPKEKQNNLHSEWSSDRAKSWDTATTDATSPVVMTARFSRESFHDFGSIACPPDSPARQKNIWDSSTLCTSCFNPHSKGQFLSNWTLAESPCHQPDIAKLHGFYISPAAFKATHEPVLIFSQSRAGGYADILYPSAWNYNDKVKYEPSDKFPDSPFQEKENTLFWRGGATEGFSKTGTWKNQVRQRLVHLANKSALIAPILLPTRGSDLLSTEYTYQMLPGSLLPKHPYLLSSGFSTSFGFVDKYPRCDNGDCELQEANFGLLPATDFQHHWRHRYLMDADGAGFSGRFLPFLQSHSVPVKTAIFREWYDSRLVAWKHFVPIDIRLHGLWSTVAYFAGGFGESSRKDPGEMIAEDGRKWAGTVLRKEDMEIYFYRLLLEYGRLTDDRRDELGFKG